MDAQEPGLGCTVSGGCMDAQEPGLGCTDRKLLLHCSNLLRPCSDAFSALPPSMAVVSDGCMDAQQPAPLSGIILATCANAMHGQHLI